MISMDTHVISVDSSHLDASTLVDAAHALREGHLVAFPTETVYGLGANALDATAVAKIFEAKGRPSTNPVIVHVCNKDQAKDLVCEWSEWAELLSSRFWPGPLSLAMPKFDSIPDIVTAGGQTVAIRVPSHPLALKLIELAGVPVAAPSANLSTKISPTTAGHVKSNLFGKIEYIVDGGACPVGIESTVLDLTTKPATLLRPGMISASAIRAVIGEVQLCHHESREIAVSPGLMKLHYAPKASVELCKGDIQMRARELKKVGLNIGALCFGKTEIDPDIISISLPDDPNAYARGLYESLHKFDERNVDRIIVASVPEQDDWDGIRDRLKRAVH